MARNPKWKRDEVILALDLYFKVDTIHISNKDERVIELSKILNKLPIHNEVDIQENFRNPNGVFMKLCNFLAFDPAYEGKGLDAGSKLDKEIWDEFSGDLDGLSQVASNIKDIISTDDAKEIQVSFDDEEECVEGKILFRKHRSIERNQKIVAKAKQRAIDNGKAYCEICGFDFFKTYGEIGRGYIECHHIIPVSEYRREMKTKVADLALICSNCHRMLHRRRPWMKPIELKMVIDNQIKQCNK